MGEYERGAQTALALFSKNATAMPVAAPVAGSVLAQAATKAVPLHSRVATSLVGGATGGLLNAMMAPPGDRLRHGAIGFASDAVGSALGPWGMLASPAINMALQHFTAPKEEKVADHADDRLKERIRAEFPPDTLNKLREQAKELELAPGRYYLPMKDKAGNTAAIAAFKTVGPKDQLVLATVLKPKNKPPSGQSLSHLMKQPMGSKVTSVAASPKTYTIREHADGHLTCSCKSYKFMHGPAGTDCKHLQEYKRNTKKEALSKLADHLRARRSGEPIDQIEEPQSAEAAEPQPGKSKSWLPAAGAAALAGLGAYKFLRSPSFSSNPALAKLQQTASSKGFHRVVDLSRDPAADKPLGLLNQFKKVRGGEMRPGQVLKNTYHHLADRWQPKVDMKTRTMSPLDKLKFWAQEGGEAIPVSSDPKSLETFTPDHPNGRKIEGVAANRHVMPYYGEQSPAKLIRGGSDVEGNRATQKAMTLLGTKGKGYEASVVQKHAPGAMPKSVSDLSSFFKQRTGNTANDRLRAIGDIQQRMRQEFTAKGMPEFALKPSGGLQSEGAFPLGSDDWKKQLGKFETHIRDPKNQLKLDAAERAGAGELAYHLGHHDLLEGHTLHHALKDPKSVMAQHWLPGAMGEWRVNTLQGAAPESMMTPRYLSKDPVGAVKDLAGLGSVSRSDLRQFVEGHLKKLPKDLRHGSYGLDVMPFRGPDGKPFFKMLETNPAERAGIAGSQGGGSGFLDSANVPWAGHAHYRAATGRHTEPVSALGGLAAAGGAAALARHLTPEQEEEEPHPAG